MADDSTKQTAKKRRLRTPSETVREKTSKAQLAASQPQRKSKLRRSLGVMALPFIGLGWLAHRPPLKQIGHALRWFFSLRFMRFLGKILGIGYLVGSWQELKLVHWPSAKQSRQLTVAVIIFSIVFGGLIAVVDFGLDKLFKQVILKG